MAGNARPPVRVGDGSSLDGAAFLAKPFRVDELLARLRDLLRTSVPG